MAKAQSPMKRLRKSPRVPQRLNLSEAQLAELDQRTWITDEQEKQLRTEASQAFERIEKIDQVLVTLREARKRKGLSQARVDEISGIGRANVSRLENLHLENPTLDTILRYAQAVGVELSMRIGE